MRLRESDVLVDLVREFLPAHARLRSLSDDDTILIAGYAVMELVDEARNRQELNRFMLGIANWSIIWPTQYDCNLALDDFSRFHLSHGLSAFALIARTALGTGAALCTFDVKHFRPIAGLVIEQPDSR